MGVEDNEKRPSYTVTPIIRVIIAGYLPITVAALFKA
jgi:hypothetical protein